MLDLETQSESSQSLPLLATCHSYYYLFEGRLEEMYSSPAARSILGTVEDLPVAFLRRSLWSLLGVPRDFRCDCFPSRLISVTLIRYARGFGRFFKKPERAIGNY